MTTLIVIRAIAFIFIFMAGYTLGKKSKKD